MSQSSSVNAPPWSRRDMIRRWMTRFFRKNFGLVMTILMLLLLIFASGSLRKVFFMPGNLVWLLRQTSIYMLVSMGLTFVILAGGIDVSVGSTLSFAGMTAAAASTVSGFPFWASILLGISAGFGAGLLNGIMISWGTIPPMIVTIASFSIFRGAAYLISNGIAIPVSGIGWDFLGDTTIFGIPLIVFVTGVVFTPLWIALNRTKFGKNVYAVGENPQAADFSGINVKAVRLTVYLLSGFCAGIAGVVMAALVSSGIPNAGSDFEIDALAAIIIGGTSMRGGSGRLGGTILGCAILAVLSNVMTILWINSYWRFIIKGVMILVGVSIEYYRFKKYSGMAR